MSFACLYNNKYLWFSKDEANNIIFYISIKNKNNKKYKISNILITNNILKYYIIFNEKLKSYLTTKLFT